jgi:hypothetical protein
MQGTEAWPGGLFHGREVSVAEIAGKGYTGSTQVQTFEKRQM